jgi:hypothetical protein
MKTTLLATTALMLGCIDLDIIGGTETTAGSTTSMTGASSTSSEGDGDGDGATVSTSESTAGDGDGDSTEGTESGDTSTETSVGDGDGEIGDGDADPGDGDGEPTPAQICWSNTIVYLEPGPQCAPNTQHGCFVGEFGAPDPYAIACCAIGWGCVLVLYPGMCQSGYDPMCEIN